MPSKRSRSLETGTVDDDNASQFTEVTNRKNKRGRKAKQAQSASQPSKSTVCVPTDKSSDSENDSDSCIYCSEDCSRANAIKCSMCNQSYHFKCYGVESDILDPKALQTIAKLFSWVCVGCHCDLCREVKKLRIEVNELKKVSTSVMTVDASKTQTNRNSNVGRHGQTISDLGTSATPSTSSADGPVVGATGKQIKSVEPVVRGTLRDIDRRKRNLVITGIPESRDKSDIVAVNNLLTRDLQLTSLTIQSTTRLGNSRTDNKHRKILAHFRSVDDVSTVLREAKRLRQSTDRFVARNVYINADLSKEDSKLEFEKRAKRRQARLNIAMANNAARDQSAVSLTDDNFPTIPGSNIPGFVGQAQSVSLAAQAINSRLGLRPTASEFLPSATSNIEVVSSCGNAQSGVNLV